MTEATAVRFFVCLIGCFFVVDFVFFFNFWFWLTYNVMSSSAVQQSDPFIHTFFFSHIILHRVPSQVIRYIVLFALQQDLIAPLLQMGQFSSTKHRLPIHPTPSPSTPANMSLSYMSDLFCFVVRSFVPHFRLYIRYHMVFLFLTYFTQYESL